MPQSGLKARAGEAFLLGRPVRPTLSKDLWVAGVVGDWTRRCLERSCRFIPVEPHTWRGAIERDPPHLLLVESPGPDSPAVWSGLLQKQRLRAAPELAALVHACKSRGIPTIFWNIDGLSRFDTFRQASGLFEYVFAASQRVMNAYLDCRDVLYCEVDHLPLAVQPRLHTPRHRSYEQRLALGCASFYGVEERADAVDGVMEWCFDNGTLISFYSRDPVAVERPAHNGHKVRTESARIRDYRDLLDAYDQHDFFVEFPVPNEVRNDRATLELLATGALVWDGNNYRLSHLVKDYELLDAGEAEALDYYTAQKAEPEKLLAAVRTIQARLVARHAYENRLATILQRTGLQLSADAGLSIDLVVLADEIEAVERLAAMLRCQTLQPWRVFVGTTMEPARVDFDEVVRGAALALTDVRIVRQPARPRHERYRMLGGMLSSDHVAVVVPDAQYAPDYLESLALGARCCEADVLGLRGAGPARSDPFSYTTALHPHHCLVTSRFLAEQGWCDDPSAANEQMAAWFRNGTRLYLAGPLSQDGAAGAS